MAWLKVQQKEAVSASAGTVAQATFLSTPVQGNLLVAFVGSSVATAITASTAGWNALTSVTSSSGSTRASRLFWKIAGASEPATHQFNVASGQWSCFLVEWSGNHSAPLDVQNATANASGTNTTPSVTPVGGFNGLAIVAWCYRTINTQSSETVGGVPAAEIADSSAPSAISSAWSYRDIAANSGSYAGATTPSVASVNDGHIVIFKAANALASAFQDNFDDNAQDAHWGSSYATGTANRAETGGQAVFTPPAATAGSNYAGYYASLPVRLTGDSVYVRVPQVAAGANSQTYFKLNIDANNNLEIVVQDASPTIYFRRDVGGTITSTFSEAYNATNHAWWRFRESGGTTFWDTSPDGLTWTNKASLANPIAVTDLYVEFGAGTFAAQASPGSAHFDNFNTPLAITATPATRALTVTRLAPVVTAGSIPTPATRALTLTRLVPVVTAAASTPNPPTNLKAAAAAQRVILSWVAPLMSGYGPVTGYRITDESSNVTTVSGNVTYAVIAGLTNGVAKTYRIEAQNAYGYSASVSFTAVTPAGTAYFVKTGGSDAADGLTAGTAWATIAKVNGRTWAAGDVIQFNGGDSFAGELGSFANNNGTVANPVVITSYGTGVATITNTTGHGLNHFDSGALIVLNLAFSGSGTSFSSKSGVSLFKDTAGRTARVWCLNVAATGFQYGIAIGGAGGGGYSDVVLDTCTTNGNRDNGVISYGDRTPPTYDHSDITVKSCIASANLGNTANTTSNTGSGVVLGNVTTALIDRCTASGNGSSNGCSTEGPVGLWTYRSNAAVIQRSLSYSNRNGGHAIDGGGIDVDLTSTNGLVQYNLAYDNDGPGIMVFAAPGDTLATGTVVRYNICYGNGRQSSNNGEIELFGPVATALIHNNTCIAVTTGAVNPSPFTAWGATGGGCKAWDNVFVVRSSGPVIYTENSLATANLFFQGNSYHSTGTLAFSYGGTSYSTLAAWRSGKSQELVSATPVGISGDPGLASLTTAPAVTSADNNSTYRSVQALAGAAVIGTALDITALFGVDPGQRDYYAVRTAVPNSIGAANGTSSLPTPPLRALVLTRLAPVILQAQIATPPVRVLTLTRLAPNVTTGFNILAVPATRAVLLNRLAPVVSAPRTATPPVRSLALTSLPPVVQISLGVTPATATLILTRLAPVLLTPRLVTPPARALSLNRLAPVITAQTSAIPLTHALVITRLAPAVATPRTATPLTRALPITRLAPVVQVTAGNVVAPATRALVLTRLAPVIHSAQNPTPATRALVLTRLVPDVYVAPPSGLELIAIIQLDGRASGLSLAGRAGAPVELHGEAGGDMLAAAGGPFAILGLSGAIKLAGGG